MRIFQIINHAGPGFGGAELLAARLHEDLRSAGVEARLLALGPCGCDRLDGAETLNARRLRGLGTLGRLDGWLRPRLRAGDLIHAHLFPASLHVALLRRLRRVPVPCVFTEHSTWNRRRDMALGRWLDRRIYRGFDRVFAISPATEAALLEALPMLRGRTEVVPNGTLLRFATPPDRPAAPAPLILSIGRLDAAKNHAAALRALARLGDRPFCYAILGEGPERGALEALARDLGLADRVRLPGHVADIEPWLRAAEVLLMPSLWEGFGLAAVEAMNAALPVVAADVPGLADIVAPAGSDAPGAAGLLVPPRDAAEIARALGRLLDDPALRRALGTAGFARAAEYGKDRMTERYIAAYRAVLEGGSR